jgi:uncharacterized membrane protein YdjX (TVP38/TMEM64 family)
MSSSPSVDDAVDESNHMSAPLIAHTDADSLAAVNTDSSEVAGSAKAKPTWSQRCGCPWSWQRKFSVSFGLFVAAYLIFVGVIFRHEIVYGFDAVATFLGPTGALQKFLDSPGATYYAPVVFLLVYCACCVLLVPASPLTILAGVLWSFWLALAIVSVSSTIGATLACLLGRTALRNWVRRKTAKFPKFVAVQRAVSKTSWLVFLVRLSPVIPFNVLNYALGLTDVPILHYVLYSWVGMLPGTALYVYIGYATKGAITNESSSASIVEKVLKFGVGPVASLIIVIIVTLIARRELNKQMAKSDVEGGAATPKPT